MANALCDDGTREPEAEMMRVMKGRIEALAGSLNAQGVANTRGRMVLEGRAGTFNAQDVANTLWGDAGAGGRRRIQLSGRGTQAMGLVFIVHFSLP